ncbi:MULTISPECIES: hypothetical protein [unclassified Leeuwenhoekiella]|uniref:hypothetical protein n=1 Tax=unclassified Leeuwenhoekiella TaxID=2615029 RepID=UPI000C5F7E37|nr:MULTISPECIES: hypothetical protein [unclassified Leeuwenhoekiella]MAW96576.1 hypothetical protein [Leeuwenhoekiella sp.]MBA81464.1 hypothetical protein [Leeuwenhoekiella sp.]|tara:strand:- start:1909 stop:2607 length:699 start_codon:yes stop_codon:yes gene_type:complete
MSFESLTPPQFNRELELQQTQFPFDKGVLTKINFALEDLCSLYNLSIVPMREKHEYLQEEIEKNPYPTDVQNDEDYRLLRINQAIDEQGDKLNSMQSFSKQVTSVYTWALLEQAENKLINLIEKEKNNHESDGFSDWKRRKKYFKNFDIKIDEFKRYNEVLELQKFNNKVKHLGRVDKELAGMKTFKNKENHPLEFVTIPLADYINNTYLYLLELMISIEDKIFPETKFNKN